MPVQGVCNGLATASINSLRPQKVCDVLVVPAFGRKTSDRTGSLSGVEGPRKRSKLSKWRQDDGEDIS